jgi:hypothetical protein
MSKLDKTQYTKEEAKQKMAERRRQKELEQHQNLKEAIVPRQVSNRKIAFVLGNGTSRKDIDLDKLKSLGKVYACNAVYRTFRPDYLVAVDVKMILEISKTGFQNHNEVWTNPNRSYQNLKNFNYFSPSKGWSSGPTALWLATQHNYDTIYILGFDYKGLDDGKKLNNLYADTRNYKKSTDGATFFGNWMRQTMSVIKENPQIQFNRVIQPDNYQPEELNKFSNFKNELIVDFQKTLEIF